MPPEVDAIVIGVGTMGAATCAELARRRRSVIGLDRFAPPHDRASHHGVTRLFRKAYYEHPDYVPLLHRAAELWQRLNAERGTPIFVQTGGVYAGPPVGNVVRGTLESARRHSLRVERWSHGELANRFPQFRVPAEYEVLFDHDGAVIRSEAAIQHLVRSAASDGADLRTDEPAISWKEREGTVRVRTERAEYTARSLVVTCGAWAAEMLPTLGVPLVVTRQVLGWVRPRSAPMFAPEYFPVWGFENADGSMHYGAPMMPGERGVKVALHARGEPTDPERVVRTIQNSDTSEILTGVERYLAGAFPEVTDSRVCLYTNSPDSHFVLGRLPGAERVFVACGFSGHGFKFAPVIGEILADLATTGRTDHPVGFLSPERFRR